MNPTRAVLLLAATALAGCNAFVPPHVACEEVTVGGDLQFKSQRPGMACAFPEAVMVTVAHAPKVDDKWASDNGEVGASELSLVGAPVKLTAGSGAVLLCPGSNCDPAFSELETTLDQYGQLTYRAIVSLEGIGALPPPGGSSEYEGTLAVETYKPGNSCPVKLKMSVACAEADKEN